LRNEPDSRAALPAILGLVLLAGILAGLVDAVAAVAKGHAARPVALVVSTASFAAWIAAAAVVPIAVVAGILGRPRSLGRKLGLGLGVLAAAPAGIALARAMHKRIPWDGPDLAAAGGSLAALALGVALVTEIVARVLGPRAGGVARTTARWAPWLVVALVPAGVHVARALRPVGSPAGAASSSNLLLLTVDTLRADRLGVYGDPRARTPWMDRLARTGSQAEVCVTPSPWTLPALASLHTGEYPARHRVLEEVSRLAEDVVTLAEDCRGSGLRTAAFVSNPWLAAGSLARGFDVFDVAERPVLLDPIRGTRLSVAGTKVLLRLVKLDDGVRLARKATSWIRDGRGAFFVWVHWFDPHLPNWPPAPFDRLGGSPPRFVSASLTVEAIRAGEFEGGEEGRREIARLYAGEVAYTDRAIGMLLRSLDEAGDLERTAIVLAADHGEEFWEHGGYGHGHSMHDEVLRVPLVVRRPGGVPGRIDRRLTRLMDVPGDALAAGGIANDRGVPLAGESLATPADLATAPTFGEAVLYGPEQTYLRTERWKMITAPRAGDSAQLFDLAIDPSERVDVTSTVPAIADTLRRLLGAWYAEHGSGREGGPVLGEDVDPAIRAQLEALGYLR
jgi:arylsulfatase A-like enzyme